MTVFCLILLVPSAMLLIGEIIMRCVLGIRNFGFDKRFIDFHGATIPTEDFLPHDVTDAVICVFSFSITGLILNALTMPVVLSVLCGLMSGCIVLFCRIHVVERMIISFKGEKLPKDRPDIDDKAVCSKFIEGDGYGEIIFTYKGRPYAINAVSANETDIEEGETVTVVHKEEGVCFVEKESEELIITEDN